jgi:hypothetical protein
MTPPTSEHRCTRTPRPPRSPNRTALRETNRSPTMRTPSFLQPDRSLATQQGGIRIAHRPNPQHQCHHGQHHPQVDANRYTPPPTDPTHPRPAASDKHGKVPDPRSTKRHGPRFPPTRLRRRVWTHSRWMPFRTRRPCKRARPDQTPSVELSKGPLPTSGAGPQTKSVDPSGAGSSPRPWACRTDCEHGPAGLLVVGWRLASSGRDS